MSREDIQFGKNLYNFVKGSSIVTKDRWGNGIDHHPMSLRIMGFLSEHDFHDYKDYFGWEYGGDGDNGESLMYELDAFFEALDKSEK